MYTRRSFIRTAGGVALSTAFMGLPQWLWAVEEGVERLTILHTNDMHSRIDPFPANDPKMKGAGGMARRAALIQQIRAEVPHVLLLDAGDIFQGTPYFNYFGGELELKLMSQMGYDAATLGNHDFDNGISGLVAQLPHAGFPFVVSNYALHDTALDGRVHPWRIFRRGSIKIGLLGVGIDLSGLVNPVLCDGIQYQDPVAAVNKYAKILRHDHGCHYVICLSHLGYEYKDTKMSDCRLAQLTSGVDLIIGGHTHTFLDAPTLLRNVINEPVLVTQAGWGGVQVGRLDITFSRLNRTHRTDFSTIKV